jgi:hypothetical protein
MVRPVDPATPLQGAAHEGTRRRRDRHRRSDRIDLPETSQPYETAASAEAGALIASPAFVPGANAARTEPAVAALALVPTKPVLVEPLDATESMPRVEPVRAAEPLPMQAAESIVAREPMQVQPAAPPVASSAASAERFAPLAAPRPVADVLAVSMTLPPGSPLELIETRFKPAPVPESKPGPAGPQRVRPKRIEVAEEPLQIIETRKDAQPPAR